MEGNNKASGQLIYMGGCMDNLIVLPLVYEHAFDDQDCGHLEHSLDEDFPPQAVSSS